MLAELLSSIIDSYTQVSPFGPSTYGNTGSIIFIVVLFTSIVIRRIIWSTRGRRYRTSRVIYSPVVYVIITLLVILPIEYRSPLALSSFAAAIPGFIVGDRFGRSVQFFQRNGYLYYKRSPVVMVIWLVSAVLRLIFFYGFTLNFYLTYLIDLSLVLTTGMLIGESIHILKEHDKLMRQKSSPKEGEEFSMMKEL